MHKGWCLWSLSFWWRRAVEPNQQPRLKSQGIYRALKHLWGALWNQRPHSKSAHPAWVKCLIWIGHLGPAGSHSRFQGCKEASLLPCPYWDSLGFWGRQVRGLWTSISRLFLPLCFNPVNSASVEPSSFLPSLARGHQVLDSTKMISKW